MRIGFKIQILIHENKGITELAKNKFGKGSPQALNKHLPDRVGGAKGWNFEKAHSILHKVREIVMWGWSENMSCQGPEHAHIDLIKSISHLTNNKDVFLCILRYHCRRGLVQQYEQMLEDMLVNNADSDARKLAIDQDKIEQALTGDRNFSIARAGGVIPYSEGHAEPRASSHSHFGTSQYNCHISLMSGIFYSY
jgi:hypothetical protein